MHAVFFKSGSAIDLLSQPCQWFNRLPSGFSCARGAPPDPDCLDEDGDPYPFDRFVPVPCSELVVKVATGVCQRYQEEEEDGGWRRPAELLPDLGNRPDCHTYVNWT